MEIILGILAGAALLGVVIYMVNGYLNGDGSGE